MTRNERLQFVLTTINKTPNISFDNLIEVARPVFTRYNEGELDDEIESITDELIALGYIRERVEEDATDDEESVFFDDYIYDIEPEGQRFLDEGGYPATEQPIIQQQPKSERYFWVTPLLWILAILASLVVGYFAWIKK